VGVKIIIGKSDSIQEKEQPEKGSPNPYETTRNPLAD
jgi:hypothetical protein